MQSMPPRKEGYERPYYRRQGGKSEEWEKSLEQPAKFVIADRDASSARFGTPPQNLMTACPTSATPNLHDHAGQRPARSRLFFRNARRRPPGVAPARIALE